MYTRFALFVLPMISILQGVASLHGLEEYSYMEYPHSLILKEECGRENSDKPIYVCDPNRILKNESARQLDVLIETVMNETKCPCSANVCSQPAPPGYRIAVALLKKIKLPQGSDDDGSPDRNLKLIMAEASNFAYHLLKKWKLGRCTEDVLILYSVMDGVIYTVTGEEASERLDRYIIADISMLRRADLRQDVFKGLRFIVSDYKSVFLGIYKPLPRQKAPPKYEAVIGGTQNVQYSILLVTLLTIVMALLSTKF